MIFFFMAARMRGVHEWRVGKRSGMKPFDAADARVMTERHLS